MTMHQEPHLVPRLARYVAGIALADWLVGNTPTAIYRLDPRTLGQPISKRTKQLWRVGTKLQAMKVQDWSRADLKLARSQALNQACVVLGGLAAIANPQGTHKTAMGAIFHLFIADLDRAAKVLRPVLSSDELAFHQAWLILLELQKRLEDEVLAAAIEDMAEAVAQQGKLAQEDVGLVDYLVRLDDYRSAPSAPLFPWPSTKGNYVIIEPAKGSKNG